MLVRLLKEKGLLPLVVLWCLVTAHVVFKLIMENEPLVLSDQLSTHWAFGWFQELKAVKLTLGIVLVGTFLITIRPFFRRLKLGSSSGNLEALLAVLVLMIQPTLLYRTDILFTAVIVVLLFQILISSFKQELPLSKLFHVGVLLAFSILAVGPTVMIVAAVYFALLVLRQTNWREWVTPIVGIAMVAVWIFLFIIWEDSPLLRFQQIIASSWLAPASSGTMEIGNILLIALMLPALSQVFSCLTIGTVTERNYTLALVGWVVALVLMILLFSFEWRMALVLGAFPIATYAGRFMVGLKKWWIADLILLVMLLAPVISNLWQL